MTALAACLSERARRDADSATFAAAEPFPHVIIDDFFTEDFGGRLLAEFPPFERGNAMGASRCSSRSRSSAAPTPSSMR